MGGLRARLPGAESNGWDLVAAQQPKRLRLLPFRRKRGMRHYLPRVLLPTYKRRRALFNAETGTATWQKTAIEEPRVLVCLFNLSVRRTSKIYYYSAEKQVVTPYIYL